MAEERCGHKWPVVVKEREEMLIEVGKGIGQKHSRS
jgi:hypothetical protein